jgi:urocanate hydratase
MAGACCLAVQCNKSRIDFCFHTNYIDAKAKTLNEALATIADWKAKGEAKSVSLQGNAADIFPELFKRMKNGGMRPEMVTDQTSAHNPLNG